MDVDVKILKEEEVTEEEEVVVEEAERRVSLVGIHRHQPNNTHPLEDTSREVTNQEVIKAGIFREGDMVVTNHLRRFLIRKIDSTT